MFKYWGYPAAVLFCVFPGIDFGQLRYRAVVAVVWECINDNRDPYNCEIFLLEFIVRKSPESLRKPSQWPT